MVIDNSRRIKFDRRQAYADAVWSFGRSSSSAVMDAQPQPHLRASCALNLSSCFLLHIAHLHYWPFRSSLDWAIRGIFFVSNHILQFHLPSSFQEALERHPVTDQLVRAAMAAGLKTIIALSFVRYSCPLCSL
jgi:hypothetical protein